MRRLYRDNVWFAGKAVRMAMLGIVVVGYTHTATEWKNHRAERVASQEADDAYQRMMIERGKRQQVSAQLARAVQGRKCSVRPTLTNHILVMGVQPYGKFINDTVYELTFDQAWKEAHAGNVWILSYCASRAVPASS